ncbi:hypothetical protein FDECE_10225 [Fusarium decemcellulare]|nr:hypothetical protein FDECE_10225 [Fusarium decemcellulare]
MDKPEWKKRFSAGQLERKRLVDRVNRRKTRGESRQALSEMEERLRLLNNGQDSELIQKLTDQNAELRAISARYRAKFEDLVQMGQLFLDHEAKSEKSSETPAESTAKSIQSNDSHSNQATSPRAVLEPFPSETSVSTASSCNPAQDSIFFQVAMYMQNQSNPTPGRILTDDFIEAFMAWKCHKGYNTSPCTLLIDDSNRGCLFRKCSGACRMSLGEMETRMQSETLFQDILDSLIHEKPLPQVLETTDSSLSTIKCPVNEIQRQRRGAAFSACHTVTHWRQYFSSVLEVMMVFWTQYRVNLFFIFPTAKNLYQLPKWRRPVMSQFLHPHPGFVDGIVWPNLRHHLVHSWNKYNIQQLLLNLTTHFRLEVPAIRPDDAISVNGEASDFVVNHAFNSAIQMVENLTTRHNFSLMYPDLCPMIPPEPTPSYSYPQQHDYIDLNDQDNDGDHGIAVPSFGDDVVEESVTALLQGLDNQASGYLDDFDFLQSSNTSYHEIQLGGDVFGQKDFTNYDLVCYEKNAGVGGTWFENRYPECACDLPAHGYVLPFEPNPNWSNFYAYAPEILKYFEDFAEKYNLHQHIRLNSKVISAVWDDEKAIYEVEIESNEKRLKDWGHVFIDGTGFLNNKKWPEIEGLKDFKGKIMHSADWDTSYDYAGKKMAVIGTGSSAIQIIPAVQPKVKHLTCFSRSATWVYPAIGTNILKEEKAKSGVESQDEQHEYSEVDKQRFKQDPAYLLEYRKNIETLLNDQYDRFLRRSKLAAGTRKAIENTMRKRLVGASEELIAHLIPDYQPGCRRPTPGDGYLEALVKPNVTPVFEEITRVVPEGIIDETGKLHECDVLVCATGFHIAFAPPLGRNGVDMKDEFEPEPMVYLALTVPKFPNYFVVNGPQGNWAVGSVLASVSPEEYVLRALPDSFCQHEIQVDYIMECLKRIQTEGIKTIEPKAEVVKQLNDHIDEWHKIAFWTDKCRSWYKNGKMDGKVWIWSGSGYHYMYTIGKVVRWEHYNFEYKHQNMWSFLGLGYTRGQMHKELEHLSPYVRNTDTHWEFLD